MTNANNNNDDIREIIAELARKQIKTETAVENTQYQLEELVKQADNVSGLCTVLYEAVTEIRENTDELKRNFQQHQENFDQHQRNFEEIIREQKQSTDRIVQENQRGNTAALDRLEAILLKLIDKD
jgi:uncharacterized coiled-coil DUF342 family protein